MAVDQQRLADLRVRPMPGEMDLADRVERQFVEIGVGVEAEIGGADRDIVDVDQQAAAGALDELAEEIGLAPVMAVERDVERGILDQDRPAERRLDDVDVAADPEQRLGRARERQQIGEIAPVLDGPGEMLRNQEGLEPIGQPFQPGDVGAIGLARAGEG